MQQSINKKTKKEIISTFDQLSPKTNSKYDDLQKSIKDLQTQLARRDEELLRMSRMYSNEKDRVKQMEKEIRDKDLIISQMSIQQQSGSVNNDTMFGRDSSPKLPPSTSMKNF